MKKTIFIILILISTVSALQDATLTLDSKEVCLAADSIDNKVCKGDLIIDGTRDHTLYILPYTEISQNSTLMEKMSYSIVKPFIFFIGMGYIALFIISMLTCAYVLQQIILRKY